MIELLSVAILLPIAAVLVRAAISWSREYQADSTGTKNRRNPWAQADGLEKLRQEAYRKPMKVNEAVPYLFIVNSLSGFSATMYSTHPPM